VVEDDKGMQDFLRGLISHSSYTVSVATDADEAFEILNRSDIDLIVSDIMLPGMNGFELCKFLKSRIDYSHIPVLILSAKSDTESKILGLDAGADAYIEKPFSGDYLIAQISTILANRLLRRRSFSDRPFSSTSSLTPNKADGAFLDRITEVINENIAEPDFNVDDLAKLMAMSRSNLHRKIKGLLQMPPNDFMRLIKLRKAAELLSEGEYRISEICYMTGFNSSSYFAKCFQKQFGVLPKEFIRQGKTPD
jgi:DNA-binding response OmpR family regulator